MEFFSGAEARRHEDQIRRALRSLLATKAVVTRPSARQWRFLTACVERVLCPETPCDFDTLGPAAAAQLKFEVQDRLRRHCLRRTSADGLVLALVHGSEIGEYLVADGKDYPTVAGYAVLVRDPNRDPTLPAEADGVASYLERVVAEATAAEFRLYTAVPDFDPASLAPWFIADGPAAQDILARAERRRQQGWVLTNPLNPSTVRLLAVRVRRVEDVEAVVGASEYWYLRWWSTRTREYMYAYRETSRQTYVIRLDAGSWKVFSSLRPSPRFVAQNRRARQDG